MGLRPYNRSPLVILRLPVGCDNQLPAGLLRPLWPLGFEYGMYPDETRENEAGPVHGGKAMALGLSVDVDIEKGRRLDHAT